MCDWGSELRSLCRVAPVETGPVAARVLEESVLCFLWFLLVFQICSCLGQLDVDKGAQICPAGFYRAGTEASLCVEHQHALAL